MTYFRVDRTFGRSAADRFEHTTDRGLDGALAALETFYFAFNNQQLEAVRRIWGEAPLVRLNNPLGGIVEGVDGVCDVYRGIFEGPAEVWVEFHDIVAYPGPEMVVFAGRERGEFTKDGRSVGLDIRTSRFLHYRDGRWRQVHHHGSITDTDQLVAYRSAVRS